MTALTTPLVRFGAASPLLSILPTNCPVHLDPDPTNSYDPNAIRVLVSLASIAPTSDNLIQSFVENHHALAELIADGPDDQHHLLGYIPSSANKRTRKIRTEDGSQIAPGNIEILSALAASPSHTAHLVFSPFGQPLIILTTGDSP